MASRSPQYSQRGGRRPPVSPSAVGIRTAVGVRVSAALGARGVGSNPPAGRSTLTMALTWR